MKLKVKAEVLTWISAVLFHYTAIRSIRTVV